MNPKCPKCGAQMRGPFYHKDDWAPDGCSYGDHNKRGEEHLHYYCECGWDQCGPLKEGKP